VIEPPDATAPGGEPAPGALAHLLREARPPVTDVPAAVARARIAGALFGEAEPVRIGRYVVEAEAGAGGGGLVLAARDPELARRVAIKLVHGGHRGRMLAEGQALARLSHPNVVPVYDVGVHGDQIYVVMELVEGQTLRDHCAPPRTARDVVRAYRQAGEGLAAAHRAGLVHRDFKPDNALVGVDGRVRVVDFGLARGGEPAPGSGDPAPAGSVAVTHAGLGTPRYMPPEQAGGATLTSASDQYAFCVSLREGLLAVAPAVPRWLDDILRRGTAASPADRFASMERLLAALARDPRTVWRRRAFAGVALAVAAAAFVAGRAADPEAAPSCNAGAAELEAVWDDRARDELRAHLAALGTPYARQAGGHVTGVLDGYGVRWRGVHRAACLAHRDATLSTQMFERGVACLARARAAFGAAVRAVSSATAGRLPDAIAAAAQLPDLGPCTDPALLVTGVAPPPPAIAAAAAALASELASLEIEIRAAHPDVRPRIADAVARARALGYPPLVARALRLAGVAALAVDARGAAIAPLAEATLLAFNAGEHALAIEAYARRAYAEGTVARKGTVAHERALAGLELVEALAAGLPDSERAVRALLYHHVGNVEQAADRRDRARAAYERALGHARAVTGPAALELAKVRTSLARTIADPARRLELARERIAIVEAALDDAHPLVLDARISAAHLEPDAARARAALAPPCNAYAELQPDHGSNILQCQYELGLLAHAAGDVAAARTAFRLAAATEHRGGVGSQLALARAYEALVGGDLDRATRELDQLLERLGPVDRLKGWRQLHVGDAWLARGAIARAAGRVPAARAALEAAIRVLEPVVAVHDSPHLVRRLERARAALAPPP
jgi:tetratricopeptide (TPR) repeat protein